VYCATGLSRSAERHPSRSAERHPSRHVTPPALDGTGGLRSFVYCATARHQHTANSKQQQQTYRPAHSSPKGEIATPRPNVLHCIRSPPTRCATRRSVTPCRHCPAAAACLAAGGAARIVTKSAARCKFRNVCAPEARRCAAAAAPQNTPRLSLIAHRKSIPKCASLQKIAGKRLTPPFSPKILKIWRALLLLFCLAER
jgi:hypothetical protein